MDTGETNAAQQPPQEDDRAGWHKGRPAHSTASRYGTNTPTGPSSAEVADCKEKAYRGVAGAKRIRDGDKRLLNGKLKRNVVGKLLALWTVRPPSHVY
jgi:hypothetical protein